MPEGRSPVRSAADLLVVAERVTPGAVELVAVMPHAARIERTLMRSVRLEVLPHLRAADEAELWASELVEVRGIDGLVIRAGVLEILRLRARALLKSGGEGAGRIRRANEKLVSFHAGSPRLVQLEEEIGWLAIIDDQPAASIQARLEVALAALIRDRRVAVARWAARALPRLPQVAKGTRAAWQLAVASAARLPGSGRDLGVRPPAGTAVVDLAAIAPHLGSTALGVRRLGDRVEFGAVGPGGVAIMVPASEPRFVVVSDPSASDPSGGAPIEVSVPAGSRQEIDTGWSTLTLRSADGQQWALPVLSEDEQRWLDGVAVRIQLPAESRAPSTHSRLATALAPRLALTAALPWRRAGGQVQPVLAGTIDLRIPAPEGLAVMRSDLYSGFAAESLPLAKSAPDGARVVSLGVDADGELVPMIGTWSQHPDEGPIVRARTRAPPEGCLGAPVVLSGQLAGVVRDVVVEDNPTATPLLFRVTPSSQIDLDQLNRALGSAEATPSQTESGTGTLTVELLPAHHGQAVLIGWGPPANRRYLLVDGGPHSSSKEIVNRVRVATGGRLELIVATHADADRIEGITALLQAGISVGDVWFNGPTQLADWAGTKATPSAPVRSLADLLARSRIPVNVAFGGGPVMVESQDPLPRVELAGGPRLTVLGPAPERLRTLASAWRQAAARRGTGPMTAEETDAVSEAPPELEEEDAPPEPQAGSETPARFDTDLDAAGDRPFALDRSINNGSSIVVLFEYSGRTVLLPGDAHADALLEGVRRAAAERDRSALFVDIFVLPHGGSRANVTRELLEAIEAGTYAVCSNGARFRHPDLETIALIAKLRPGSRFAFNYRSDTTARWDDPSVATKYGLRAIYPAQGGASIVLELAPPRASA